MSEKKIFTNEFKSHAIDLLKNSGKKLIKIANDPGINRDNFLSWEKKFKFDVWYVDNLSFTLDLKILFLTFKKVIVSEGISSETSVTMEYFTGNN